MKFSVKYPALNISKKIKVVTWNANSIKDKINEFKYFLYKNNYDIAGICETKTDKKFKLKIPGYKVYLQSRDSRGGGVALIVKESIEHHFFKLKVTNNIEAVAIKMFSNRKILTIVQVYKPPNKQMLVEDLNSLFCNQNIIVMGDLNSKRQEWRCPSSNADGGILLDFCLKSNIVISTPLGFTNFPPVGRPSILDIFLLKCGLTHSLPLALNQLSSNHSPVEMVVAFDAKSLKKPKIFNYTKANWKNFKKDLNEAIDLNFHLETKDEVETKTDILLSLIDGAMNKNIPKLNLNLAKDLSQKSLRTLITIKNKFRKLSQKNPSSHFKKLHHTLQKMVRNELARCTSTKFEKYVKKLNFNDGSLWKFSKRFAKKTESPTTLYDKNLTELNNDKEIANAFAVHFAGMSNVLDELGNKSYSKKITTEVNKLRKRKPDLNEVNFVKYSEVLDAIKALKNNKASGDDGISAIVLKNLPRKAIVYILKLINGMFITGHFPDKFKIARVIPIYKKGKDATNISSYRPISLLSHLSKIVEKIIKKRLLSFVNDKNILINEQFGFRAGHCTTDQLARLINQITSNFNKKLHTGALLLDIEAAFPTVWHVGIIWKLLKYGFPIYLILLIASYLENRKFYVSFNNIKSELLELLAGVPQGSVLGPLLFIIFINDAPKIDKVDDSIFADDKLLLTSSYRISAITNRLKKAMVANKRFFDRWKIKINPGKTEVILFTKRRPSIPISICLENVQLNWSKKVKYLGVMLDSKLNFGDHVNFVSQKAISNLIKFYPIFKNKYLSIHSKLIFYKSLIRTGLLYACPVWSLTSDSNLKKIQIIQNKFLRIIGNYRRFTQIETMHRELKIEPIKDYMKTIVKNYFERVNSHRNKLVRNIIYDTKVKYKHKRIMYFCK